MERVPPTGHCSSFIISVIGDQLREPERVRDVTQVPRECPGKRLALALFYEHSHLFVIQFIDGQVFLHMYYLYYI